MPLAIFDITRKRGDTKRINFRFVDNMQMPIDISGWNDFRMAVDPSPVPEDDSNNVLMLRGEYTTDGTDGRIYFVPTGLAPAGVYFYDAQAFNGLGEKCTFVQGRYTISQDITKV